jgi:Mg2+ and Co2+ transporter CorA
LKRFKDLHEKANKNVQLDIHRAHLNRQDGPEVVAVRPKPRIEPTDYDNATRDVLRNFQDSGTLGQAMVHFRAEVVKVGQAVKSMPKTQKPAPQSANLKSSGKQISGQLAHILGRYDIFIERNRLTTNEASLLMTAFWNLIAQRDNKINQKIATESKNIAEQSRNVTDESKQIAQQSLKIANQTQKLAKTSMLIAKQTKRDSSAVKAISLLTMVFLPATYSAVSAHSALHAIVRQ